jgi:hypothetical protein
MKTLTKLLMGIGLTILVSGCVQPKVPFDPNNKGIAFVDGTPYRVPYGATYMKTKNTPTNTQNVIKKICRPNDVLWKRTMTKEIQNEIESEIEKYKKSAFKYLMSKYNVKSEKELDNIPMTPEAKKDLTKIEDGLTVLLMRKGYFGCSKPLSNKEYQYYLNQQNQQMIAAQQQQAMYRMYNQQMMQNTINNNNQMLMWQNNQFYRNLNTINNNTASWWRYTH